MTTIQIEVKAPELCQALQYLADALRGGSASTLPSAQPVLPAPVQPAPPVAIPTQTAPPQALPVAPPPAAPLPVTSPVAPAPLPTAAPTYTHDMLSTAAAQLMDAGKRELLVQMLAAFGVQSLPQLPQEQLGAFAAKLREQGVQI